MTFWLLYFCVDQSCLIDYPFHFAYKETCDKMGKELTKVYKYENYRCVKEVE